MASWVRQVMTKSCMLQDVLLNGGGTPSRSGSRNRPPLRIAHVHHEQQHVAHAHARIRRVCSPIALTELPSGQCGPLFMDHDIAMSMLASKVFLFDKSERACLCVVSNLYHVGTFGHEVPRLRLTLASGM